MQQITAHLENGKTCKNVHNSLQHSQFLHASRVCFGLFLNNTYNTTRNILRLIQYGVRAILGSHFDSIFGALFLFKNVFYGSDFEQILGLELFWGSSMRSVVRAKHNIELFSHRYQLGPHSIISDNWKF